MATSHKIPVVGIRQLPNGNAWLVCKERGIGVLAATRSQGISDMKAALGEEFTIRTIEDPRGRG